MLWQHRRCSVYRVVICTAFSSGSAEPTLPAHHRFPVQISTSARVIFHSRSLLVLHHAIRSGLVASPSTTHTFYVAVSFVSIIDAVWMMFQRGLFLFRVHTTYLIFQTVATITWLSIYCTTTLSFMYTTADVLCCEFVKGFVLWANRTSMTMFQ